MASIKYTDPELEGSFSFSSSYDFNSSLSVFSDDDDDDESYIEIAIEPTTASADDDNCKCDDDELEVRISFSSSSTVALAENFSDGDGVSASSTKSNLFSHSSAEACTVTCPQTGTNPSTISRTAVAFNRLLNTFQLSTSRAPLEETRKKDDPPHYNNLPAASCHNTNHLELVTSRKASNTSRSTSNNGMMMKYLIKFRSIINVGALLASVVKTHHQVFSSSFIRHRKKRCGESNFGGYQSVVKPFDFDFDNDKKWLTQRDHQGKKLKGSGERSSSSSSTVFRVSVRGVLESMRVISSCKEKGTIKSSCSSSTSAKSSPIHQGFDNANGSESKTYAIARENSISIQAAIAHCKSSLGQSSDFCF